MRAALLALIALVLLPLAACGGGNDTPDDADAPPFETARAMRDLEYLAKKIGPRPAGSDASRTAAEYIVQEFAAARFGIVRTNFTFETDRNRPATVQVGGATIEAITAGGSKDGSVTGPAAALPTTAERGGLSGKIAVARRGGTSFQEKHDAAWASGAAGLVIINSESGSVTANLGEAGKIPVVTVPGSDGERIEAALSAGEPITITVPPPATASGTNITARARGAHACTYIVVANYDSLAGSPGANDNASGVAVMLELARQFNDRFPVPEMCFVAIDARFSGGQGAARYLETLTGVGRPAMVISISDLGAGDGLVMYGELTLKDRLAQLGESLGVEISDGGAAPPVASGADVFRTSGASLVEIARSGGPEGRDDTLDRIDAQKLTRAGQLIGELTLAVSAKRRP